MHSSCICINLSPQLLRRAGSLSKDPFKAWKKPLSVNVQVMQAILLWAMNNANKKERGRLFRTNRSKEKEDFWCIPWAYPQPEPFRWIFALVCRDDMSLHSSTNGAISWTIYRYLNSGALLMKQVCVLIWPKCYGLKNNLKHFRNLYPMLGEQLFVPINILNNAIVANYCQTTVLTDSSKQLHFTKYSWK